MKRLLFILLLLPMFARAQIDKKGKPYELHIYFYEHFKDTFKVYFNGSLISKEVFATNESTGACDKYITVRVPKSQNHIAIENSRNKLQWKLEIALKPTLNYLYLRRYSGVWSYELSDKLLEVE